MDGVSSISIRLHLERSDGSVRKKLALDQREAAEIFGGGVNAFSRYENGKTKPPLSLVKLLKVLERHPDLLAEIRTV
jgi:HTH-type transcriptional regulator/antitoxin MqsA